MEQNPSPADDKQDSQDHLVDSLPPLRVTLKGMSTMRNAASTTVVYAPPDDPSGTLQSFCESILENLKPYLPKEATPRQSEQETAKEESKPPARPALESFPHPDSYKSVISVLAAPAPPVPLERLISPPAAPLAPHLSHRQQKRLTKQDRGKLQQLILHATLLNTIYVRKRGKDRRRPLKIDARPLLERFKDMVWMEEVQIEKICLYRIRSEERRVGKECPV